MTLVKTPEVKLLEQSLEVMPVRWLLVVLPAHLYLPDERPVVDFDIFVVDSGSYLEQKQNEN